MASAAQSRNQETDEKREKAFETATNNCASRVMSDAMPLMGLTGRNRVEALAVFKKVLHIRVKKHLSPLVEFFPPRPNRENRLYDFAIQFFYGEIEQQSKNIANSFLDAMKEKKHTTTELFSFIEYFDELKRTAQYLFEENPTARRESRIAWNNLINETYTMIKATYAKMSWVQFAWYFREYVCSRPMNFLTYNAVLAVSNYVLREAFRDDQGNLPIGFTFMVAAPIWNLFLLCPLMPTQRNTFNSNSKKERQSSAIGLHMALEKFYNKELTAYQNHCQFQQAEVQMKLPSEKATEPSVKTDAKEPEQTQQKNDPTKKATDTSVKTDTKGKEQTQKKNDDTNSVSTVRSFEEKLLSKIEVSNLPGEIPARLAKEIQQIIEDEKELPEIEIKNKRTGTQKLPGITLRGHHYIFAKRKITPLEVKAGLGRIDDEILSPRLILTARKT